MPSMEDRETTVTGNRTEGWYVWTNDPVHLRKFEAKAKEGRAQIVDAYEDAANFKIPASEFDPIGGFKTKRKPMSEEQRAKAAERLRNVKNAVSEAR